MNAIIKISHSLACLAILLLGTSSTAPAAGSRSGTEVNIILPESFSRFGSGFWASGGAGVAGLGMPGAPFANPAALNYPNLELYIEATQRLNTTWLAGIDYDGQTIVPSFASAGFSTGAVSLAFGYANLFDLNLSLKVPEATENFPEGTGRFFEAGRSVKAHALFSSVGYTVDEKLSLGLTAGIHYVHIHDYIFNVTADGGGFGLLLVGGGLFRISDRFSVGSTLHFESPTTFTGSYQGPSLLSVNDTSRPGFTALRETYEFKASFPWSVNLGAAWAASPSVDLLASVEYQHWSHLAEGYSNLFQFHIGAQIELSEAVNLHAGFFTQAAPQQIDENPLSENFLTAGFRWRMSPAFAVSANVIDSHLASTSPDVPFSGFPDARFRQSAISLGVTYTMPGSHEE
jgi:long-subunit fatty acid transport protein